MTRKASLFTLYLFGLLSLFGAVFSAFAQADTPTPTPPLDKNALAAYLRHLFLWPEQVKISISDPRPSEIPGLSEITVRGSTASTTVEERLLVTSDGHKVIRGFVYDLRHSPFQYELSRLTVENQPRLGPPGAPVSVVLFVDFQCPYCRQQARVIRENLVKNYPKEVVLYLKDFPIDQAHPWARRAAVAGRCLFRQGQQVFWNYHDWVFENQSQLTPENFQDRLAEYLKTQPVDPLLFSNCLQSGTAEREVESSLAEARSLQVSGTPTFFINGRRVPQLLGWPQLKALIDFELAFLRSTGRQGVEK